MANRKAPDPLEPEYIGQIIDQVRTSLYQLLDGKHRVDGAVGNNRITAYWVAENPLRIDIHGLNVFAPPTEAEEEMGFILAEIFSPEQIIWQQEIGRYTADYYLPHLGIVVEVDGDFHLKVGQAAKDAKRDAYMQDLGLRIERFTNKEVLKSRATVAERLRLLAK